MPSNEFCIVTRWRLQAGISEIAAILSEPREFPRWWGRVYLDVQELSPGDADGVGARIAVHSKGWLPYHLHWQGTLVENRQPHGWTIAATGDLTGRGVWRLTQQGDWAEVLFDWRVLADRPLFRLLAPVLAPVFAWNHRWAMAEGEAGLARELVRRRQAGS